MSLFFFKKFIIISEWYLAWKLSLIKRGLYFLSSVVKSCYPPILDTLLLGFVFTFTWHLLPLLDLFQLMSWKRWLIRLRHLSVARGFECSTTLLIFLALSRSRSLHDIRSSEINFDTFSLSHKAVPLSSNLIDMNESAMAETTS